MATSTTYNRQQILEMIQNQNSLIEFHKPKHAKSLKWENYLQVFVNGYSQCFISCTKCRCILAWKSSDGTNVMDKHDKACKQQAPSTQQSIKSFYSTNNGVHKKLVISTKRKLANVLAECCAKDSLPFNFVNGVGFKELAENLMKAGRQLGPNVSMDELLPDSTTISRHIDIIYNFRKEQLISYLETMNYYVITVDFWTESKTKIHYGGVTIHTYSEEHGLQVFVLACKPYDLSSQSAENIRLFTNTILESYGLMLDKVKYVVSDNENKMRSSFRNNVVRIGCATHFINKIIEHALCKSDIDCDAIQQLFNDIHDIVVYLRSCHNQSKLSKKLQLFSKSRWNSAYEMISSFINVFPELNCVITDKDRKSILSRIDFDELLAFAKYLKYFVDVTELLSSENTPTIHLVLLLKQRLINLSQSNENDHESLQKFKKYFEDQIPTYWEVDDVHYIAAVLHPNMKHLQKSHQTNVSYDSEAESPQQTSLPSNGSNDILSECYDQPSAAVVIAANDEFKRYLQSTDTLVDNEDLLTFWKQQKDLYPIIYSIARDILIIPASNTAVERLFSASGRTVTDTRTRLSGEKLDKLMFIKKNLSILKNIFGKSDKLYNHDLHFHSTNQKGEKRSHENLSSVDGNDIVDLNDLNDDSEEL